MIRALCTATGAVWWACAAIVLAVVGIGLLRAFWRDWRTPRCRYCSAPITGHERVGVSIIWRRQLTLAKLCAPCAEAWITRRRRLPREVMG